VGLSASERLLTAEPMEQPTFRGCAHVSDKAERALPLK
jgi:hypothetical protein